MRRKRAIFIAWESSAGVSDVGVGSGGGGGVVLEPRSFSPAVSAVVIAVLIGVGEGASVVGSMWLLVAGSLMAVGVSIVGVAGALAVVVVVGVAGAAAEAASSGAKNSSVVVP